MILPSRNFLWAVGGVCLGALAGSLTRYFFIEVHEIGQICDPGNGPLWCVPRQAIVQLFLARRPLEIGALGVLSLLFGIGALLHGNRILVHAAALICGFGVALYNADLASIGLVLTLIAAARRDNPNAQQH